MAGAIITITAKWIGGDHVETRRRIAAEEKRNPWLRNGENHVEHELYVIRNVFKKKAKPWM